MDLKEEEERERVNMEQKVKKFLELSEQESETVSGVAIPELRLGEATICNLFALRGIRVDRVGPGFVACTFKDELEITSRLLGQKGGYSGTIVLMRNKATGEIISQGRNSLFRSHTHGSAKL